MGYPLPAARVKVKSARGVAPASPGSYALTGVALRGPLAPRLVSTPDDLIETYGIGPAVKVAAYQLGKTGVPVLMRRVLPTAQAASLGALDLTEWTGANPPTLTGIAVAYYKVVVEITTPGEVDTAAARYSLDGGETFTSSATVTGPITLDTSGLTFTPGAGTLDGSVAVQTYPAAQAVVGLAITRIGSSTATPSIAGAPLDVYEGRFEVLAGGTLGAAKPAIRYRYSLDGGRTYTREFGLATATTVTIRDGRDGTSAEELSGLTLTLGSATETLEAGDVITFNTTAPVVAAADVLAAIDELRASQYDWEFVHVASPFAGTGVASVSSRFQSWALSSVGAGRYTWGVFEVRLPYPGEARADWKEAVDDADFDGLENGRASVTAGDPRITCPITGRRNRRPVSAVLLPELWSRPIEEDPMRVATGALTSDVALYENGEQIAYDARQDVALHASRFVTLRTYEDFAGVYVTRGSTFDLQDGEESRIPRRRVLDLASRVFQRTLVVELGGEVEVQGSADPVPGAIDPAEAERIETSVNSQLDPVLGGRASEVRVVVNRTTVLTPSTPVNSLVKVVGLQYLDLIDGEIGFTSAAALAAQGG